MTESDEPFVIRIVKVDYYMASPVSGLDTVHSDFRNKTLTKVPVIRIFGITADGKKACAHLHGVFPYVSIPWGGIPTQSCLNDLAFELDRCLSANGSKDDLRMMFVYKIEPVCGIPYYGYHQDLQQFLRIHFIYPRSVDKAVECLQSGLIMNRSFQPHEAHLPYILQMFIDYNLFGMNFAEFKHAYFRSKENDVSSMNVNSYNQTNFTNINKETLCEVEVDVTIDDILNPQNLKDCDLNPGIAAIWEDAKIRRRYLMESSQLTPVCSQERSSCLPTTSETSYLNEIDEIISQANNVNSNVGKDPLIAPENDPDRGLLLQSVLNQNSFVSSGNLTGVSLTGEDLDLCNILNDLINLDTRDQDVNGDKWDMIHSENEICIEYEDDLTMSQSVEHQSEDIDAFDNYDSDCESLPQVDGPISSPKSRYDHQRQSTENFCAIEDMEFKVFEVESPYQCGKRKIKVYGLSKDDNVTTTCDEGNTVSIKLSNEPQQDETNICENSTLSNRYDLVEPLEEAIDLIGNEECTIKKFKTLNINGIKVNVRSSLLSKKQMCQLGKEKLVIERVQAPTWVNKTITNQTDVILDSTFPRVIITKLNDETIMSYQKASCAHPTKKSLTDTQEPLASVKSDSFISSYNEQNTSNALVKPSIRLKQFMKTIVDLQQPLLTNSRKSLSVDTSFSSISIRDTSEDVMFGLSYLSPQSPKITKSDISLNCHSPTGDDTKSENDENSDIIVKPLNFDLSATINCTYDTVSSMTINDNCLQSRTPSQRASRNRTKPKKFDDCVELDFLNPIHKSKTTIKKSNRQPKPSRVRPIKASVKEDLLAVEFLTKELQSESAQCCKQNQAVPIFLPNSEVIVSDVSEFTQIAATEVIADNSLSDLAVRGDDEEECWLRILTMPANMGKKRKISSVKAIKRKTKNLNDQPKRPRKRTKKNVANVNTSAITFPVGVENQTMDNWSNDFNLFDLPYIYDQNSTNSENNCAVIVEPINNAIYSDNLISIYEDDKMDTFLVESSNQPSDEHSEIVTNPGLSLSAATSATSGPTSLLLSCFPEQKYNCYESLINESGVVNKKETKRKENVEEEELKLDADLAVKDTVGAWEPNLFQDHIFDQNILFVPESASQIIHSELDVVNRDHFENIIINEETAELSENVNSFYDYNTFVSPLNWTNSALIDSSKTNVALSDTLLSLVSTSPKNRLFTPNVDPPSPASIKDSLAAFNLPNVYNEEVHCSHSSDAVEKPLKLGGGAIILKLQCQTTLQEAEGLLSNTGLNHWRQVLNIASANGYLCPATCTKVIANEQPKFYRGLILEPSLLPPNSQEVKKWLKEHCLEFKGKLDIQSFSKPKALLPALSSSQSSLEKNVSPIMSSQIKSLSNCSPCLILESTPLSSTHRPLSENLSQSNLIGLRRSNLKKLPLIIEEKICDVDAEKTPKLSAKITKRTSQIDGPTPKNKFGFKLSEDSLADNVGIQNHNQHLTIMSLELYAESTGSLLPNPKLNEIRTIFYHICTDTEPFNKNTFTGIMFFTNNNFKNIKSSIGCLTTDETKLTYYSSELELISEFIKLVQNHDPDILLGYEIEMSSWGFLMERALELGVELWPAISRAPNDKGNSFQASSFNTEFRLNIVGRIVLTVGDLMKSELSLYNYSFENVAYHVLHKRIPLFSYASLRTWFDQPFSRWRAIQYFLIRVKGNILLLENLNVIGRTSELARLFGIQFEEVLTRGSQFRVESMMLRLCKSFKYIAVSPNVQQRAAMRAPECLPLIMEPISKFFTDPVIVLDFQSLYPSIIIAYNYCFSTCLGRVANFLENASFAFGCTSLKVSSELIKSLKGNITVSPCGVAFVKSTVRKGVLSKMLEEILAARVMVKLEMKKRKNNPGLKRLLDARQLGLKLISNVTYGYTAANFSGRMPCVEVADSVVSKGRETLERAIHLVENTSRWGAKVVYGDTDSLFVLLEGKSKEQAFAIGQEISEAVTAVNPKPIKLKLEKVYLPCVLETKKRYVGFMYESPETSEPVYDAKGIETVRRDGCPVVAKILERSLKILFKTKDVSQVRSYVQHQFHKLNVGRCSLNDFIFTREYKGRNGYSAVNHAPALKIARQLVGADCRAEPRIGERVSYVIVYGNPGDRLIDLVRHPNQVLMDPSLRLNTKYYINNVICAPLARVFNLIGINVKQWYSSLPKNNFLALPSDSTSAHKNSISRYFLSNECLVCGEMSKSRICNKCSQDSQMVAVVLLDRAREWERRHQQLTKICHNCTGTTETLLNCISLDCPILFRLARSAHDACQAEYLRNIMKNL